MNKFKLIVVFVLGFILAIGIGNAYKLNANDVTYDKKTTTLESNTVSGAIDELGVLATTSMSEVKAKLDEISNKIDQSLSGTGDAGLYALVKDLHDREIGTLTNSISSMVGSTDSASITVPDGVYAGIIIVSYAAHYGIDCTGAISFSSGSVSQIYGKYDTDAWNDTPTGAGMAVYNISQLTPGTTLTVRCTNLGGSNMVGVTLVY